MSISNTECDKESSYLEIRISRTKIASHRLVPFYPAYLESPEPRTINSFCCSPGGSISRDPHCIYDYLNSLGQCSVSIHDLPSSRRPWHCLPPNCGAGLVHVLLRVWRPFPQVTEQLVQLPQSDQPPSTKDTIKKDGNLKIPLKIILGSQEKHLSEWQSNALFLRHVTEEFN